MFLLRLYQPLTKEQLLYHDSNIFRPVFSAGPRPGSQLNLKRHFGPDQTIPRFIMPQG
jgi:hypothetical protein